MELTHPKSTHALPASCMSAAHQDLLQPMPLQMTETYIDMIDCNIQALSQFLADQPSQWGNVDVHSSSSAWLLSPPSVAGFASYNVPLHSNAHFDSEPHKMFTDQIPFGDCQEIKQESMIPMMIQRAPQLSEPYYFAHQPSHRHPPALKNSSPAVYKEKLRTRQRGYEKVYRKKKRVEFKHMRREWIQLEMKHHMLRERMHSHPSAYLHKASPSKLEALHLLQLEERALRQDLMSLQSLKAWHEVSILRLPVDKGGAILRTAHEWETVSDCLLGVSCTAPFAPLKLTFSW